MPVELDLVVHFVTTTGYAVATGTVVGGLLPLADVAREPLTVSLETVTLPLTSVFRRGLLAVSHFVKHVILRLTVKSVSVFGCHVILSCYFISNSLSNFVFALCI